MLGLKVIYVRCIICLYNNVTKGIRLLDKKTFLLIQEKFMQVRAFERYTMHNKFSNCFVWVSQSISDLEFHLLS